MVLVDGQGRFVTFEVSGTGLYLRPWRDGAVSIEAANVESAFPALGFRGRGLHGVSVSGNQSHFPVAA